MSSSRPDEDGPLLAVLERSKELGFLGPGPITSHVLHARAYLGELGDARRVLDLGSGGGVPGLVLARARPDVGFVLLDAMEKRCRFLDWAVEELGLTAVRVLCGRAEELARQPDLRAGFERVLARSFAAPAVTAECAAGFLTVGGHLVVSEPPDRSGVDRWPVAPLDELGMRPSIGRTEGEAHLQVIQQVRECPDRFPRRVGVPAKRPLF